MDEKEIYETLGLTPPGSPETPQESGEPQTETGGGGPEDVSKLDTSAAQETGNGGDNVNESTPGDVPDGEGQSKEDSGKDASLPDQHTANDQSGSAETDQAALWRAMAQQEVQRAVEAERARNQAEWEAFFASAGVKNSLNGDKPITSLEEFRAWKAAYDRAKLERDLADGKLTPEALAYSIKTALTPPDASREVMGRQPQRQTSAPEVTKEQIDAELAEIHRLDGRVNGLEDILKLETGGAFQEAVRRGHSFLDAFKLANFDQLQSQRQAEAVQAAQRAAQAARNSARSKDHLLPTGGKGGEGSAAVPGDVMEMYRMMMPGASEADISAHYNRVMKDMKT